MNSSIAETSTILKSMAIILMSLKTSPSIIVKRDSLFAHIAPNRATDLHDMCDHVLHHKGEKLLNSIAILGRQKTFSFMNLPQNLIFELSLVFDPADQSVVASKVLVAGKRTATEITPPKYQVGDLQLAGTTAQRGLKLCMIPARPEGRRGARPVLTLTTRNPKGRDWTTIEEMKSRGGTDAEWGRFPPEPHW